MIDHWFWKYAFENKGSYFQAGVATFFVNIFALAVGFFVMVVYDRIIPNNAITSLTGLFFGASVVILLKYFLELLKTYFLDYAGQTIEKKTSGTLFDKILAYDLLRAPKSNGAVASLVKDFETFQQFFTSVTILILIDIPFLFLFLYVIYVIGGAVVYVPMALIPAMLFVSVVLQPFLKNIAVKSADGSEKKQAVLLETLQNMETVKSISGANTLRNRWMKSVDEQAAFNVKSKFLNQIASSFSGTALMYNQIGIVTVGVFLIADGKMSMGALIGCVIISGRAMAPVAQVAAVLSRTNVAIESFRRVNEFMLVTSREEETRGYVKRGEMSGPVAIKNLTFRYPESQTKLFDNLTLEIEKSTKVAMLGRIGSGKSTFLRLCLGLYYPDDGMVLVDGTNITQVRPEDLRKNFGVVPQTVSLFSGTVGENITIGVDDYDEKFLLKVSEVSGVMSWLGRTPNGFDYKLSEGGKELSGGQRQTIAIARALIRKPHYIILDEPTANMDTATEQLVLKNLAEYFKDETVLIVTHRMAPLSLVSRIVVLDNGKVNVDGPKEKILERLKGAA